MPKTLEQMAEDLRAEALTYPETYEENPWGDRVVKVKGKMFFLCGVHKGKLYATAKLPVSGGMALQLPFAEPTHYGMGKHGWVTATFEKPANVPVPMILEWIEESFRAVAPKTVLKTWEAGEAAGAKPAAKAKPAKATRAKTSPVALVLVGDDELRLRRARKALEERGFTIAGTATPDPEALDVLARKKGKAVIIDLGRREPAGLELAGAIARSEFKGMPVFFAGARDAASEKHAKAAVPKLAGCARVPPGDPEFVELVFQKLSKSK